MEENQIKLHYDIISVNQVDLEIGKKLQIIDREKNKYDLKNRFLIVGEKGFRAYPDIELLKSLEQHGKSISECKIIKKDKRNTYRVSLI